jgi:(E)-4-hydroxy-3-methylbut-2-enyl-diphosphate synthase
MPVPFRSRSVTIGNLSLGGDAPVRIQSMTNTSTSQVEVTAEQCTRMIRAGAELIRMATQGSREVKGMALVREALSAKGMEVPLVADIHFKPKLALEAARVADKIRINPGNYLVGGPVEEVLPELLKVCKEEGTAIRIGINHGSLAEPILREYGNTPSGMVESAMQFLRICRQQKMDRVVVSLKSSNPRIMIQSVRLLADTMAREGLDFPLHLGVTEAGGGTAGRIKSAVGIAPLLLEGLGDTIRVSLTEPPEAELPVARMITGMFPKPPVSSSGPYAGLAWDPFSYRRRSSISVSGIGNGSRVKIISRTPPAPGEDLSPGQIMHGGVTYHAWREDPGLLEGGGRFLLLERGNFSIGEIRSMLNEFCLVNQKAPVVYRTVAAEQDEEQCCLQLAGELGSLLVDGAIDAVQVESARHGTSYINEILLDILQAAGARISKTEYIACPSCGRTHFDIISRLKEIRDATSHLVSLKIGVMGCIVNGPGEMADADYGYVGAGPGRVTLYKGKDPVVRNIPEKQALAALIGLMKEEGDWVEPPAPLPRP